MPDSSILAVLKNMFCRWLQTHDEFSKKMAPKAALNLPCMIPSDLACFIAQHLVACTSNNNLYIPCSHIMKAALV